MNNNVFEINSLIYNDQWDLAAACSEVRHDRNRADGHGRVGFFLNGVFLENDNLREVFLNFLRNGPLSRSISIDARFLENEEVINLLTTSPELREIRIIDEGYTLTEDVLNMFPNNITIVCDNIDFQINEQNRNRIYTQYGLFKKETNYIGDDLVSGYFITRELSDRELDHLVDTINRDNSGDYRQISFRVYDPSMYNDLVSKLHDRGLNEDVRINFLGNPLYDRSEVYEGLNDISNNIINITYDTCSDMINYYTQEPYSVSNMHHSELEGGGIASFDSYLGMLSVLEQQEEHIKEQNYSPLEAAIYAYRFLQQNYAYDPDIDITDAENILTNRQLDIVTNNSTLVCEGYATLYSALLRRCGIPMFRYSTDRHVRNIGRIVDPKYGVDSISVFDPTFDSSHILDDGTFEESRSFCYFMMAPWMALYFDPYITLATSLVVDYENTGNPYLSFVSKDLYESDLILDYCADAYTITMLDLMGIQLPAPLNFDDFRNLISDLNKTTIFDAIDLNTFADAYTCVLQRENSNMNDLDRAFAIREAITPKIDLVESFNNSLPTVCINGSDDFDTVVPTIYPNENTLNISDFNKRLENNESYSTDVIEDAVDNEITTPISIFERIDNEETEKIEKIDNNELVNSEADIEILDEFIAADEISNIIDDVMQEVEIDSNEYIPGTRIVKPRFRDPYETDEEYVAYLADYYGNYFPQAQEETHIVNGIYVLTKNQIIQDLPIYSRQESRYTGVMTDEEIEISRGKLR